MKTSHIFWITFLFIILIFVLAAANFDQTKRTAQNLSAASLPVQTITPTPIAEDVSEVGSTDGIVIMGVVLVIIVTIPVLFRKKRKKT